MRDLLIGTITFLFTDIEGSTRLWEEHPEAMRVALVCHDALLREIIAAHRGHVFGTGGVMNWSQCKQAPPEVARQAKE